jgi:hypothetical protein
MKQAEEGHQPQYVPLFGWSSATNFTPDVGWQAPRIKHSQFVALGGEDCWFAKKILSNV